MNHTEALREKLVERYLLGELAGDSRNSFEEHLFDCPECAADVKLGVVFLEGLRAELVAEPAKAPARERASLWAAWLNPAWMAPALAACLAVAAYQTFLAVPHMKAELARANEPAVMHALVLAGGATRGGALLKISAPADGSFLLSVDIPPLGNYASYVCALSSPSGAVVWRGDVPAEEARDTVQIRVPAAVTQAGENVLVVQGVRQGDGTDVLATHKFVLEVHR